MSTGPSVYLINKILDAVFNNTSLAIPQVYIQLHIGDPGASGTSNAATETTRKAVSVAGASSAAITSDTDITWTGIAGSEDATHHSFWDASSGGNFLGSGVISAAAYTVGNDFVIPAGDLDVSFAVAA